MTRLIGLGGYMRAGKDEAGLYLASHHNFTLMGMSDALNDALQEIGPEGPWIKIDFDIVVEKPWLTTMRRGKLHAGEFIRYRDLLSVVGYVEAKRHRDVREYLQGLGTEVGREMMGQNVWVDIAAKKITDHWDKGRNVAITATRFPNELVMIENMNGITIWIDRSDELRGHDPALTLHPSETSVSPDQFMFRIENNGTKDELHLKIDNLIWHVEDILTYEQVGEHRKMTDTPSQRARDRYLDEQQ